MVWLSTDKPYTAIIMGTHLRFVSLQLNHPTSTREKCFSFFFVLLFTYSLTRNLFLVSMGSVSVSVCASVTAKQWPSIGILRTLVFKKNAY